MKASVAFASGTAFAAGWYFGAQTLSPSASMEAIAVGGAIAIASFTPTFFLNRDKTRVIKESQQPLWQRLNVLDKHVIVNVVDENHCVTEVNERFCAALGYTEEEVIGKPMSRFYFEDLGKQTAFQIRDSLIRGRTWQGETPLRCKDGSMLLTNATVIPLFDSQGHWIGSIAARTDVTRVNQLLAEKDTVETLDELRDDIWIVDAESGYLTYMNRAAMRRADWKGQDYRNKSVYDLPDSEGVRSVLAACEDLKKSDKNITHFETTLMGVPFLASIKFLRVPAKGDRYLVMLNDISDRKAEERQKSEFISMVSHELRSPLTSIKGSMGLLLSKAAGEIPDKAIALLEIAHRNADRLVLIINDILDLEKIAAGRMEFSHREVDLSDLIEETKNANAMLRHRFGLDIKIEGASTPLMVNTDPNRIIQVLTNFLSNACKFSRPNSQIILRVEDMGDNVRVSVKDQGQGIPKADRHKIFERFADLGNSDRSAKGGTGLGLSICKAIIESLGGTVGFDSEEGVGTTFYFVLPKGHSASVTSLDVGMMREAS